VKDVWGNVAKLPPPGQANQAEKTKVGQLQGPGAGLINYPKQIKTSQCCDLPCDCGGWCCEGEYVIVSRKLLVQLLLVINKCSC